MSMPPKEYLGAGAYVERDEFGVFNVTTQVGDRTTNTVAIEADAIIRLVHFVAEHMSATGRALLRDAIGKN